MEYNDKNPLRIFEAFGGYGSQSLALKRLRESFPEFCYKIVGYCDIDQAPISAYMALHSGENIINYGDITTIMWREVPDFDLFTYSFPCTDISQAGRQAGLSKDSGTRSSLLWECEKAIDIKRPRFLLMENVAALVSNKFIKDFQEWICILDKFGYNSFTKVLDTKNFGVPQHRERVFVISILRTDDNQNPRFNFPQPFPLEVCLADVLEPVVDESFFLSDEMLVRFCEKSMEEEEKSSVANIPENENGEIDYENFLITQ